MGVFGIALIITGEILAIGAELFVAHRLHSLTSAQWWAAIAVITIGGLALLFGYYLSYVSIKNIWVISAISISAVLVVEPLLDYLLFSELPTTGALIGLILGTLGVLAALLIP